MSRRYVLFVELSGEGAAATLRAWREREPALKDGRLLVSATQPNLALLLVDRATPESPVLPEAAPDMKLRSWAFLDE